MKPVLGIVVLLLSACANSTPPPQAKSEAVREIEPTVRFFNLETGYQFAETLQVRERIKQRYGVEVEFVYPETTVAEYEAEAGPFEITMPEGHGAIELERFVGEIQEESLVAAERVPVFQQVALMSVRDRVMLAIKGTREARMILVRDPNRIVACAVLRSGRGFEAGAAAAP